MMDYLYDPSKWFYQGLMDIRYMQHEFQSAGKGKYLTMMVQPAADLRFTSKFELKQSYKIHRMMRKQRKCMPRGKAFERMFMLEMMK